MACNCSACGKKMENSKNWKVIRQDQDVFKLFLELVPGEVQLSGRRICRPCFSSVEKLMKNSKKVDQLQNESQVIRETITNKLKELYQGQPRQEVSVPVRAKRSDKRRACRSLPFSAGSPGVFVSINLLMTIITHLL